LPYSIVLEFFLKKSINSRIVRHILYVC
jgi:hypothetical protein